MLQNSDMRECDNGMVLFFYSRQLKMLFQQEYAL